jgi:hypothetical protein
MIDDLRGDSSLRSESHCLDARCWILDSRWLRRGGEIGDGAFELQAGREIIYVFKKRRMTLGQWADIIALSCYGCGSTASHRWDDNKENGI